MSDYDVAVIGAGPYGLSVTAHLRAARTSLRIFGRPMNTWRRHMPDGMFLKSEGFASSIGEPTGRLTLRRFCEESGLEYGDIGQPVPLETFVAYGAWFREQVVPDVDERTVTRLERDGNDFRLQLDSGDVVGARRVVAATGLTHYAYVPPVLRGLASSLVTHTSDHSSFERFDGRTVAVVGAGQSAIETAVLLDESGASPHVVARAPRLLWNPEPDGCAPSRRLRPPTTPLGNSWRLWAYTTFTPTYRWLPDTTRVRLVHRVLGPAGAWWLRPRLRADVPVLTSTSVSRVEPSNGGVRLGMAGPDRRELEVEHVIAGTGYRVGVERLDFLAPELRRMLECLDGAPRLSRHFESSVPGLYFVGLSAAITFGPAMRFVCGSGFAARHVAGHVAARRPRLVRQASASTSPSR
jgi:Pyridine nucleotide-disulphide oxidoreductase